MAEVIVALGSFILGAVAGGALAQRRRKTVLVPVAKRVEGRIIPDYSRSQRRAHKRRSR